MGKIVSVVSGKGGTGKSTFAVGLGYSFARKGKSVLLIDFDIGLRCLDIMLGLENKVVFDIGDVVEDRCTFKDAVTSCSLKDYGKLHLLCSPISISKAFDFKKALEIVKNQARNFDYIIIDLPAGLGFSVMVSKALADITCVIATPDVVSVRDCTRVCESIFSAKPNANCRLVVNRISKKSMKNSAYKNLDEIIDAIGIQLIGLIGEDDSILKSINGEKKTSLTKKIFNAIADRINEEYVELIINNI